MKIQKNGEGGWVGFGGGQGGCERRSEAFVEIQKKCCFFFICFFFVFFLFVFFFVFFFCFFFCFFFGGVGGQVDENGEVKLL